MTTSTEVPPSITPPSEPAAKPNGFARLAGVIFNPAETFKSIVQRPDFLVPVLLVFIVTLAFVILVGPRIDFVGTYREAFEANKNMPPEQMEKMVVWSSAVGKAFFYVAPALSIGGIAIIAGILLAAFRLLGGEGTYRQAFSVTLYCQVPSILRSMVAIGIAMGRGQIKLTEMGTLVPSNLGVLTSMTDHPMQFALLSSFDLFGIWALVLLTIGFSALSRLPRVKSAVIIVSLWLVVILFKLGGAAMQTMRMKR